MIPETHGKEWENAKKRNPAVSQKSSAYAFLWTTNTHITIRALNDDGLNSILVGAFGEFPLFNGFASRRNGIIPNEREPTFKELPFVSYSTKSTVAKRFGEKIIRRNLKVGAFDISSVTSTDEKEIIVIKNH